MKLSVLQLYSSLELLIGPFFVQPGCYGMQTGFSPSMVVGVLLRFLVSISQKSHWTEIKLKILHSVSTLLFCKSVLRFYLQK